MTRLHQIYQCKICGNIVTVLQPGKGELVCCGQPMELQVEKTEDEGYEKHVPVIGKTKKGIKVKIGSIAHPMIKEHFIQWIEVKADGQTYRQFLKPGDKPEAEFCLKAKKITAREYCNIHGLWKK